MGRKVAIIDSMTAKEKKTPKIIDQSRRNRIAKGAGVQVQDVNQLVKEYDMMAPIMKSMAGKGMGGRMQAIQDLQKNLMADPTGKMAKPKGDTGKRLSPKERLELKKKREKELRRRKRQQREGSNPRSDED
jgi:signal recognition particle subunit SRP54